MFEAMTTATWLAARTERLTIGHLVLCDALRHPVMLARQAVTIDHASGGRFELGIGWGSVPQELEAFGVFDTSPRVRVDRLGETLEVLELLWSGDEVSYEGRFFSLKAVCTQPTPTRSIPVVIGGTGPRTLALVARHADWWNVPGPPAGRPRDDAGPGRDGEDLGAADGGVHPRRDPTGRGGRAGPAPLPGDLGQPRGDGLRRPRRLRAAPGRPGRPRRAAPVRLVHRLRPARDAATPSARSCGCADGQDGYRPASVHEGSCRVDEAPGDRGRRPGRRRSGRLRAARRAGHRPPRRGRRGGVGPPLRRPTGGDAGRAGPPGAGRVALPGPVPTDLGHLAAWPAARSSGRTSSTTTTAPSGPARREG